MTATGQFTPRSLREILEAGENPLDAMPHRDGRVEHLVDLLTLPGHRDQREREREMHASAQRMLEAGDLPRLAGVNDEELAENIAMSRFLHVWVLELLDDPSLVERVIDAVPDPVDRLHLERSVDGSRRGYPLEAELCSGTWDCDSCGGWFEPDQPFVGVGHRENQTNAPTDCGYEPAWCVECVRGVLAQAEAIQVAEVDV